jgi:hypothetical protein
VIGGDELRRLDPRRWYKPLDVGEAGVACSVNPLGRMLVVTAPHPVHGQVQLTAAPDLPDRRRYDQAAVRRYRTRLSEPGAPSFGLSALERRARHLAWLWQEAIPVTPLPGAHEPGLVTLVTHPDDAGGARGVVQVRLSPEATAIRGRFTGRLRLARAPYPQLTEGGRLPPAPRRPTLSTEGGALILSDKLLDFAIAIGGDMAMQAPDALAVLDRGWLRVDVPLRIGWRRVVIGLGDNAHEARDSVVTLAAIDAEQLIRQAAGRWRVRWENWPDADGPLATLARRGLAYILGCCAVPVGDTVCLITDHRLLPLAWTRDGYFVARALLDWGVAVSGHLALDLVRHHLAWLFEVADRPDAWWARSHLIGGQRKDEAYQLDQQLYPWLELADYTFATGDHGPLGRYASQLPEVLRAIEGRSDPATGLLATEETAADDPTALPYQAANQILAWHSFSCLVSLGVGGTALADRAERLRNAVARHLVTSAPDGSTVLAYATDGRAGFRHYHDANDLPLALAPTWGFNSPDDEVWRATVRAAFAATHNGFATGQFGGLGSVHSAGSWPLGHLQQLLIAGALGDEQSEEATRRALQRQAQWDDLLPEASDPTDGHPVSRPWFAWPGALAASAHLHPAGSTPRRPGNSPVGGV